MPFILYPLYALGVIIDWVGGWVRLVLWTAFLLGVIVFVSVNFGDDKSPCLAGEDMDAGLVLSETPDQFILDEPPINLLPATTLTNCTYDGKTGGSYAQLAKQFQSGPKAWKLAQVALKGTSREDTFRFKDNTMYGRTGTPMPTHIVIVRIGNLLCEVRITTGRPIHPQEFETHSQEVCAKVQRS